MQLTRQAPGRAFTISLGLIALITPLAVHLFFTVIPAVKAALDLSDDGLHNGSAGVTFMQNHDAFKPVSAGECSVVRYQARALAEALGLGFSAQDWAMEDGRPVFLEANRVHHEE